jgi:Holliday junction DNA helicase RuvB
MTNPVRDIHNEDPAVEAALRPLRFDDYTGQDRVKERLRVAVRAAALRGGSLDHVLLTGPPGLGKTTLAAILAHELGVHLHTTSGPAIEKKGDLAGMLTSLAEGDVLFIDEIHRMSAVIEENLYPAMEDFFIDIMVGEGAHSRSFRLDIPRFTLVGTTTRVDLLTNPLRDRFGIVERLDYYDTDALSRILHRSAALLSIPLRPDAALEMAHRSRGTPRIANRLLRRIRDYMDVAGLHEIDRALCVHALDQLDIDRYGLDWTDRAYLDALLCKFGGGPVGLDTLAAALGESPQTLEDVHEPFFIQLGFLQRTPRGRVATPHAFEYLGLSPPSRQLGLFGATAPADTAHTEDDA